MFSFGCFASQVNKSHLIDGTKGREMEQRFTWDKAKANETGLRCRWTEAAMTTTTMTETKCPYCEEHEGREFNAETIAAMHEDLSGARTFNSVEELFADLMSDNVRD
jgi:hypothetical protein